MDERMKRVVRVIKATGFKLDPYDKADWIDALRSGDFPQSRSALYVRLVDQISPVGQADKDGFCCLGVYQALTKGLQVVEHHDDVACFRGIDTRSFSFVSYQVIPVAVQGYLSGMNDDGYSFSDIADVIEAAL